MGDAWWSQSFDAAYAPREKKRGLYEIRKDVDKDVRAQFQQDEANKMKKLVQSLKACQICHAQGHSAPDCTNMKQVRAAEGYEEDEVNYYRESNMNPPQRYERKRAPAQPPYRPPGHYEREAPRVTMNDDLRDLILNIDVTQFVQFYWVIFSSFES